MFSNLVGFIKNLDLNCGDFLGRLKGLEKIVAENRSCESHRWLFLSRRCDEELSFLIGYLRGLLAGGFIAVSDFDTIHSDFLNKLYPLQEGGEKL